ncbi:hypothetical protein [Micromonospora globbae]|uniref:ATP/GTP-binding protein n=1 Tax=Micromonospora globbae TaxID=1894969 RepID=A0A420EVH4_9ACTN|nr:hypothetical protein [Micromonospora globbae]RKF24660.1 hypothetical protein D7I43_25110 [Micromonospora globbae]
MLRRTPIAASVLILVASVGALLAPGPAYADYEHCDALGNCYWVVEKPGTGGGGNAGGGNNGGGSAGQGCSYEGQPVPCVVDELGVWDGSCYVKRVPPPPGGRTDGYWSIRTCVYGDIASQSPATWSPDPPAGILPSYQELAQRAIAEMKLDGPNIGIAPRTNGSGLVGLPIWLWNNVSPTTWGPITRTAAVPGRSVTATARAQKVVWSMGDGNSVTCTKPGTPYQPSFGNRKSPDCGYDGYSRPSSTRSGGRYTVTATTSWLITWSGGGGNSGSQSIDLSSTTTLDIGELQVITS